MDTMQALVKARPEPGAELSTEAIPQLKPFDVLVRVKAAAICGTDVHIYDWTPYAQARVKPPMVFGHEFCGEVVATGPNVTRVATGDLIAGETHVPCGNCLLCNTGLEHVCKDMKILGVHIPGVFSEYAVIPESVAWKLPADTPPLVGAILEPVGVGVHAAYAADVRGATVLVTGCGPIGLTTIGVVKSLGARLVIASDVSEKRLELAREFGADIAVSPLRENVVELARSATSGLGVDVAIEASGAASAVRQALASTRRAGQVVLFGLMGGPVALDLVEDVIYKELNIKGITGREMWRTWYQVMEIVRSGAIDVKKLVTHEFHMSEFEEAIKVAKSGGAGKVVLYPGR